MKKPYLRISLKNCDQILFSRYHKKQQLFLRSSATPALPRRSRGTPCFWASSCSAAASGPQSPSSRTSSGGTRTRRNCRRPRKTRYSSITQPFVLTSFNYSLLLLARPLPPFRALLAADVPVLRDPHSRLLRGGDSGDGGHGTLRGHARNDTVVNLKKSHCNRVTLKGECEISQRIELLNHEYQHKSYCEINA